MFGKASVLLVLGFSIIFNVIGYNYVLRDDLTVERRSTGMIPILPTLGLTARF